MASWTDSIPQFNPYVQQLPVEAMVEVGMEKQKRYDEGIQKIQSYVDNIAGLDVVRDIDKAYLQTKLNELGGKLMTVAAGDFSNYQLVNSVGGMANQITKDKYVQNAVSSTAWYRKQVADMEKAISEGKSSQQNQWDFNNKANAWLTSNDINYKFKDRYTPYTDVTKKWFEVVKSLHADLREEDIPYERNADGSINYQKTAAGMHRISKETVSAEKIENALRATLTPDELNQLSIDGRYTFRGYDTPEKLSVYASSKYTKTIEDNDARIKELEGIVNLSQSNPKLKKQAEDSINSLRSYNQKLSEQMKEETDYILSSTPDEAKTLIYKNGAISQFAKSFAWEQNKQNILTNPILEAQHWERNFALDQSKFNLDQSKFSWQKFKDKFDMDMADKDFKLKVEKQQAELYGLSGGEFETYLGQSTNVKNPYVAINDDIFSLTQESDGAVRDMAKSLKLSVGQLEQAISDYENGKTTEANKIIPVQWRDQVWNEIINKRSEAKRLKNGIDKIESEVLSRGDFADRRISLDKSLSTLPTVKVGSQSFSQKEIFDFMQKGVFPTVNVTGGGMTMGTTAQITSKADLNKLTKKERAFYDALGRRDKVAEAVVRRYTPASKDYSSFNEDANKERDRILMERGGTYIPRLETITFGSGEGNIARRRWEQISSNALYKYTGTLGSTPGGDEKLSKDDATKAMGWLSGDKKDDVLYKRLTQGKKTYIVLTKGGEEVMIPLTDQETAQLPMSSKEPSNMYKNITEAQYFGDGSTNPTGKYEDAYFNRSYLPNVKNLNIKADLNWDKNNTAKQYVNLMLNTEMGTLPLQLDDYPMSRDEAIRFINGLTDTKIKSLYLANDAIPNEWKEYIKTLK